MPILLKRKERGGSGYQREPSDCTSVTVDFDEALGHRTVTGMTEMEMSSTRFLTFRQWLDRTPTPKGTILSSYKEGGCNLEVKSNHRQSNWHSPWSERGSGQIQQAKSFSILWTQCTSLFLHRTYHCLGVHKTGPLRLSENMHKYRTIDIQNNIRRRWSRGS